MHTKQYPQRLFSRTRCSVTTLPTIVFVVSLLLFLAQPAQAQTYNVIYNFPGGHWAYPAAGLTMDAAGNFYGTTVGSLCITCGCTDCGGVFRLIKSRTGWIFIPIHAFQGGDDGSGPYARVVFGPDGSLYGTTLLGGSIQGTGMCSSGCGTVFKLTPPAGIPPSISGGWTETILYRFKGGSDGAFPFGGDLIFDEAGNIYGTTGSGGRGDCGGNSCGIVFELKPSSGGWTETALYAFTGGDDGGGPGSGVILDASGNLYGTTLYGGLQADWCGYGCGTVFQLTPSGSGWREKVLYTFQGDTDGRWPDAGMIFGNWGELYGSTSGGGSGGGGTVFALAPGGGSWTESVLYSFSGGGPGPEASLTLDGAGNLYGTAAEGGLYGWGSVFKLTPGYPTWTYISLHDFLGNGEAPISNVTFDASGNLYGTASARGSGNAGVIWQIKP